FVSLLLMHICNFPSSKEIQTFGGSADRPECVFPFIYKGVTYNSCTKVDSSQEWCSITTNYDEDKLWGYCTTEGKNTCMHCPFHLIYFQYILHKLSIILCSVTVKNILDNPHE
uniref:Fibronectin type-II domain-containing protein n=1 Tax=Erpetoichthys calabaricus TaxID=27687 RepID=A0A8C4RLJ8_ERPCA